MDSSAQQGETRTPVNAEGPSFQNFLQLAKRRGWLVLLVMFLALAAAFLVVSRQTEMYRASTLLALTGEEVTEDPDQAETLAALFDSEAVALGVIARLGLDTTPKKLLKTFNAAVTTGSGALEATYDAPSPNEAERTLRAFSASFSNQIETKLGVSPGSIRVFQPPHADPQPIAPRPVTTLAFAGLLGLALGLLIAVFVEKATDGRRRRSAESSRSVVLVPKEAEVAGDPPARDAGAL